MSEFESSGKVPLTIQEFNSDDKLEQANKLINTLAERPKISIILSMLLFFQKKNFPKMLKDYLIEGVKDYIQFNPGRVISYNGDPFTRDNCIRGMSVVIGKHRVIQKEVIDGAEYLKVNLVQTAIFLSDEISKICQGPRGNRPIHCSLVDEPKYEFKKNKIGLNISEEKNSNAEQTLGSMEQKSQRGMEEEENEDEISNSKLNLDMGDDDEFSAGQEQKILNNPTNVRGHIISLGDSDEAAEGDNFARPDNINRNNDSSKGGNLDNNDNNNLNNNEDNLGDNNEITESKNPDEINNFGDAPSSLGGNASNLNFDKILDNKPRNKKKEKNKNGLDLPKSKYPFNDIVSVKNIGKHSQVNNFLRDNKESILRYLELFKTMQKIGQEGLKNLERLERINPTTKEDESRSQMSKDENTNTENDMEDIFSEFEIKKENLIRVYKRIQTTVGSIYSLGDTPDLTFINDDVNYLNENSKFFNQILEDMFPLFDKINEQTQHYSIAKIIKNLQKISDTLKDNDIGFKNFFVFVNSMINRIPVGAIKGNSLCDMLGEEVDDINERKKQYLEILVKEKDSLVKVIEPILKKIEENKNGTAITNNEIKDENMKEEEKTETDKISSNVENNNDKIEKEKEKEMVQEIEKEKEKPVEAMQTEYK